MTSRSTRPASTRVRAALTAIAAGRPVVVVDDMNRENEGNLILAASLATTETIAFLIRHTSGFLCVALPEATCDRLGLPAMHHSSDDPRGAAYCVATDLRDNGTGISATARARTIAALGDPDTTAADLVRPGHVIPLRGRAGGVLTRRGHTEAGVDLTRLAGVTPAAALAEIVSADFPAEMARRPELERFAAEHGLVVVTVADIVEYRRSTEARVVRGAIMSMPTQYGQFDAVGYRDVDGNEHIALVAGSLAGIGPDTPTYVHHECLAADIFGVAACDCGVRLASELARFGRRGSGVVVFLRNNDRACGPTTNNAVKESLSKIEGWILEDLGVDPNQAPQCTAPPLSRTA
ncbi:3,4-dihydroxy-2-butanone-4-phosphate synthase [Rhodococcus sp. NCIMB 12038]|jgi:3,4-dihydroxy 2-butanone 4-phosphate synthase/GTP cyclohydrolase II|uniref:3,4-dihydroxy-2-butanone-4-phosphate synthase n=1 Tax=Rhodococcus sp. NCIMB 12038 TaxID=933800 RepID=UPI000B3CF741|nr:3,4-dihydroxy-2-butanone-4-phosphate synthase [Rhodococcus sp. NCIMB 12038]OUS88525.1 3,4-dihydroxy-2-butanone-4-phosphate synthase [Rhodococcus sp. NCIMB 12038]